MGRVPIVLARRAPDHVHGPRRLRLRDLRCRPASRAVEQLTNDLANDGWPAWSPDGTTIAFTSERDDCRFRPADAECWRDGDEDDHRDVWLIDPDGANERRATSESGQFVAWSPDSRYLLVSAAPCMSCVRTAPAGSSSAPMASASRWAVFPTGIQADLPPATRIPPADVTIIRDAGGRRTAESPGGWDLVSQLRPPEGVDLSDQVTIVPANEATGTISGRSSAHATTRRTASASATRCGASGTRCSSRSAWSASASRPTAITRALERHAGSSPTSTESRSAGARSNRTAYARLRRTPVPWKGRDEDPDDDGVWSVICFVTRAGFRRRGVSRALARATIDFARGRGARALEGYPMITEPGKEVTWGELNVGSRSIFADAGSEVSHPTLRRVVMRIDFEPTQSGRRCRRQVRSTST